MKKGIKFLFGIFLIISTFCVPLFSYADSEIGIYESDIDVQMWPEIPEPYKNIDIAIVSYATDLTKARIEWRVGGDTVLSGYGKTDYSMTSKGPGTITNITISIVPVGSLNKIIKNITLKPVEIEVFWEAVDGYTPPFYKGKSFVSQEGLVRVVAIPLSSTIKKGSGDVSYRWKRNDDTVLEASGYNKTSYTFTNSALKNAESISLLASSIDGSYAASKNITIPIYSPRVIFYKKSPTEGILYNKALVDDSFFEEEEITLVAEPYFLAIKGRENYFDYKWSINGDRITTPNKKTELTIRPTSRGGYADISLVFEDVDKLFQKVAGYLKLSL